MGSSGADLTAVEMPSHPGLSPAHLPVPGAANKTQTLDYEQPVLFSLVRDLVRISSQLDSSSFHV